MFDLAVTPALGAFAGIQYRYWIVIVVAIIVVLALIYFLWGRNRT